MMTRAITWSRTALLSGVVITAALALAGPASAGTGAPHLIVTSEAAPTQFHPGDSLDFYEILIQNDGGAPTQGSVTVTDTLPAGVTISSTSPACEETASGGVVVVTVKCAVGSISEDGEAIVDIYIDVPADATGTLVNSLTVSDEAGTEAHAQNTTPVTAATTPVPFGATVEGDLASFGGLDTLAGTHPLGLSTQLAFNVGGVSQLPGEYCSGRQLPSCAQLNAQAKDLEVMLPPGLIGNPTAIPQCTQEEFEENTRVGCPPDTQVGEMKLYFYWYGTAVQSAPVYNIKPPPGQPAELGFTVSTLAHIPIFFKLRSGGDYGLTAVVSNVNQFDPVRMALLSVWGFPSDPSHDLQRESHYNNCTQGCAAGVLNPKPFLRTPTSCTTEPLSMSVAGDSWQNYLTEGIRPLASASLAPMTGCSQLVFTPSLAVSADTRQAGAPAGYTVHVHVPQNEEPDGLATPDVRNVEVTFPTGTVLSASGANGLQACTEAELDKAAQSQGNCPGASNVGTVNITTPLLTEPVKGSLYVGEPGCSPCSPEQAASGQMVRIYLEARAAGVYVKLIGHTKINQSTGQLTAVFEDNPQLPVSDIEVTTEHGPDAPLANPVACGEATTTAQITPWSSTTPVGLSSTIPIEGCGTEGFNPGFQAGGTTSARAGAFSGFDVALTRQDGEQTLGRVSVTTPPGLLGVLKSVEQCQEAQANAGTCSSASQIGTGSIVVGPGSSPLTIPGSRVYLTGPYGGKPFGLSVVTPAVAGPFVLAGNTGTGSEVVRASIAVDPHTGALTVTSDPLPQQLNGVPLDVRKIDIEVNRNEFLFSPTSCAPMSVNGTITSALGTAVNVSTPFQSTGCATLPFKPTFKVSTQGKTSKKNGASLHVKVTSGQGQANIAKVKVNLPIALPSRTSTLQKACVDSVFETNPASCGAESVVGHATAVTPLLKNPLTGPAYIVSHAGRSFPDLDVVLQGEGITLILAGNTDIKKGITSSTFKAVPDAPVSTFDLVLPEGPHSILAAFGNLCTSKLNMATVITGHNGAVVRQTTKIAPTGCSKRKRTAKGHGSKAKR